MKKVSTYEAKAHLSQLTAEVKRTGKPITICRSKRPVVDIVPHRDVRDPLEQAPHLQGARFHGDAAIRRSSGRIFMSAISSLEIALLVKRNKLELPLTPEQFVTECLRHHGITRSRSIR